MGLQSPPFLCRGSSGERAAEFSKKGLGLRLSRLGTAYQMPISRPSAYGPNIFSRYYVFEPGAFEKSFKKRARTGFRAGFA